MPIADFSLQDKIKSDGPLTLSEAKSAALDILAGLIEVKHIVHRDLKPGNVLWHEGRWKISDFGIAKFVEDATSLETLRSSLTPAYAAPEQWRGERPSNATDVYSLGCILYAMLAGQPPFVGDADDIREAHLKSPAPTLPGDDVRLSGLVATMLRKAEESRPSLERCLSVISSVNVAAPSAARAAIAAAGHAVSQEEAAAEAERSAQEALRNARVALAREATQELDAIFKRLFDAIDTETDSARRNQSAITLGPAHLMFDVSSSGAPVRSSDAYGANWDIAAHGTIKLRADRGARSDYDPGYYQFSANLIFAKIPGDPDYRWREISFHEIFSQRSNFDQPFSLDPFDRDFQVAVSNVMGKHQIAHGPLTIDGEDEASFQERWLNLFAKAAARQLHPPQQLPVPDHFFK
jgi:serine/threonine-protein kinase